jgi:hypothetical protein
MKAPFLKAMPDYLIEPKFILFSADNYLGYIEREYVNFDMPCINNELVVRQVRFNIQTLNKIFDKHPIGFYRYISLASLVYADWRKRRIGEAQMLVCDATAYTYITMNGKYDIDKLLKKYAGIKAPRINYNDMLNQFLKKYGKKHDR